MFGRLESVLQSEVKSLGYPRAALFAFGVSVLAYNVLLELAANVRVVRLRKHPRQSKKKTKKEYVPGEVARRHVSTARVRRGQERT